MMVVSLPEFPFGYYSSTQTYIIFEEAQTFVWKKIVAVRRKS